MHDLSAAKRLVVDRRRSGLLVRGEEHAEQAERVPDRRGDDADRARALDRGVRVRDRAAKG